MNVRLGVLILFLCLSAFADDEKEVPKHIPPVADLAKTVGPFAEKTKLLTDGFLKLNPTKLGEFKTDLKKTSDSIDAEIARLTTELVEAGADTHEPIIAALQKEKQRITDISDGVTRIEKAKEEAAAGKKELDELRKKMAEAAVGKGGDSFGGGGKGGKGGGGSGKGGADKGAPPGAKGGPETKVGKQGPNKGKQEEKKDLAYNPPTPESGNGKNSGGSNSSGGGGSGMGMGAGKGGGGGGGGGSAGGGASPTFSVNVPGFVSLAAGVAGGYAGLAPVAVDGAFWGALGAGLYLGGGAAKK